MKDNTESPNFPSDLSSEKSGIRPNDLYTKGKHREAFELYLEQANQGVAEHQIMVGWMYEQGLGVDKNFQNALHWYEAAASQGSPEGQFYLGVLHSRQGDFQKAVFYYEKSAIQDYMPAIFRLGWAYQKGRGVNCNKEMANTLFQKSAELVHIHSQRMIAGKLISGSEGFFGILKGVGLFTKSVFQVIWLSLRESESDRIRW